MIIFCKLTSTNQILCDLRNKKHVFKNKFDIRTDGRNKIGVTRGWDIQTLSFTNEDLIWILKRRSLLDILWVIGHMKGSSRIWKPWWWSIGVRICHHSLWRSWISTLRIMILILTMLQTPIGRGTVPVAVWILILTPILITIPVVPVVVLITIIIIPIIAVITIIRSLILRVEPIVEGQSCVIILETHLTLNRAPTTTASSTAIETTSATVLTTTRTLWIWRILIRIRSIGVWVWIWVVILGSYRGIWGLAMKFGTKSRTHWLNLLSPEYKILIIQLFSDLMRKICGDWRNRNVLINRKGVNWNCAKIEQSRARIERNLRVEQKIRTDWNLTDWSFASQNRTCTSVNWSSTRICGSHGKGSNSTGYHVEKIWRERERERIRTCVIEDEENTKALKSRTRAVFILLRFSYNCQLTNTNS